MTMPSNDLLKDAYELESYNRRIRALATHDHTVNLFDDAPSNRLAWPLDDFAVKQDYHTQM